MKRRLIILGAGGYGRTIADIAAQTKKWSEISFLDDNTQLSDVLEKCDNFEKYINSETDFYPAFGNNSIRFKWIERMKTAGCYLPSIIHPSAYISPTVTLGNSVTVLPMAIINTDCMVSEGCIINCGAIIDHGCILESCVHVCLGAVIKAENRITQCSKIEASEVIPARVFPV